MCNIFFTNFIYFLFIRVSRLTLSLSSASFISKVKGFLHKISSSTATWNPPGRYSPFLQDSFFFLSSLFSFLPSYLPHSLVICLISC